MELPSVGGALIVHKEVIGWWTLLGASFGLVCGCSEQEPRPNEDGQSLYIATDGVDPTQPSPPVDLKDANIVLVNDGKARHLVLEHMPLAWPSGQFEGTLVKSDVDGCFRLEEAAVSPVLVWPPESIFDGDEVTVEGGLEVANGDTLRVGGGRVAPEDAERMLGAEAPCEAEAYLFVSAESVTVIENHMP